MRSRYLIHDPRFSYFITGTIVEWLPVFTSAKRCDILVEALRYCQEKKELKVCAWVILDTHFHAIVSAPDLSQVLADLKRHTARRVVEQLEAEGCDWLLNQLRYRRAAHKAENEYQVWQEGSHTQRIADDAMMLQKLDYLHRNPVRRGLVLQAEHWRYSSAHEWLPGAMGLLRCDAWK